MAYVYREKNAVGKPNFCSCSNVRTKAFCQSDFCAELDSNGAIIYRGSPGYSVYPALRDNANGSGYYDNQNKSIGHRSPCNLQLEIYNAASHHYCTDCEDLNGIYDSTHLQAYNGIDGDGSMWHWPLCNPDRIGNACGASFAYGYLGFDENDGFNPVVDSGRNVYLNIRIANQDIDYRPTGTPINRLCTPITLPTNAYSTVISGCPTSTYSATSLAHKRVLVGEIKYNNGYYDSNVDCTSFSNLEVNEDVHIRGLCTLDFKVTSKNEDDLKGFKRSIAHQWGASVMSNGGDGYPFFDDGWSGLRYNLCDDSAKGPYATFNPPPSYYGLDLPTLTTEYDPYWNITRVYEKQPILWNVTISNAEGIASGLNAEHFLFPYKVDFENIQSGFGTYNTYTDRIDKQLYDYDSTIATENLYGNYNRVGCDNTCINDSFCINRIKLDLNNNDDRLNAVLSLTGQTGDPFNYTNLYVAYSGSVAQGTNKGWLDSPLTLNFGEAYYSQGVFPTEVRTPINNIYNLENLTVTLENDNTYSDVNQMACFPVPRNPNIKGGKEPDAFLVEFTDDWIPGFMKVQKPIYHSAAAIPQEMKDLFPDDWQEIFAYSRCEGYVESPPDPPNSCGTLKLIDDCYSCGECNTNCEERDWSGPVGSFILTRDFTHRVGDGVINCFPNSECNNIKTLGAVGFTDNIHTTIRYAYTDSNPRTICNWHQISLEIVKGTNLDPCDDTTFDSTDLERMRINMSVYWPKKNENEPVVGPWCADLAFHPNQDQDCSPYCVTGTSAPPHTPCETDIGDCIVFDATPCNYPCQYNGEEYINNGENSSRRFFYADLPLVQFENFKYVDFDVVNGYDLTYYDDNSHYDTSNTYPYYPCGFSQCNDEGEWEVVYGYFLQKVPIVNPIYHGKWGGGTVKVTPIFY